MSRPASSFQGAFRVDGASLPAPSYLLPTLHAAVCADRIKPGGMLRGIFPHCETHIAEYRLDDPPPSRSLLDLPGVPWPWFVPNSDHGSIRTAILEAGLDPSAVEHTAPFALALALLARTVIRSRWTMDAALQVVAEHEGLEVIGLETADEQLDLVARVPPDEGAQALIGVAEIVLRGPRVWRALRRRAFALFRAGRFDELFDEEAWRLTRPRTLELLLHRRDERWLQRLVPRFGQGPAICAVGAAHLRGLIAGLRACGAVVKPVVEVPAGPPARAFLPVNRWLPQVEREAARLLGRPVASAVCLGGAADTRAPVFLSPANLARKGLLTVPAPDMFWFPADPGWTPLEFEDSFTRIRIAARRRFLQNGLEVVLTRLVLHDKAPSPPTLGGRSIVVAQTILGAAELAHEAGRQGWAPALIAALVGAGASGALPPGSAEAAQILIRQALSGQACLHVVADTPAALPLGVPRWNHRWAGPVPIHGQPVTVRRLKRLSCRWGFRRGPFGGAAIFSVDSTTPVQHLLWRNAIHGATHA